MSEVEQQIFIVQVCGNPGSGKWRWPSYNLHLTRASAVQWIGVQQADDRHYHDDNTYRIVAYRYEATDAELFYQDLDALCAVEAQRRAVADEAHEREQLAKLQQKYGPREG